MENLNSQETKVKDTSGEERKSFRQVNQESQEIVKRIKILEEKINLSNTVFFPGQFEQYTKDAGLLFQPTTGIGVKDVLTGPFMALAVRPDCYKYFRLLEESSPEPTDFCCKKEFKGEPPENTSTTFSGISQEICKLHEKKNNDYGDAAYESYKDFGLVAYIIRLGDKYRRLKSLTTPGKEQMVKEETVEDTLLDLAAYSIMAIEALRKNKNYGF